MTALNFFSEDNRPCRMGAGLPPLTSDEDAVSSAYLALLKARKERDYTDVRGLPRSEKQRLTFDNRVTRAADALECATSRLAKRQPGLIVAVRAALLADDEREYRALHELVTTQDGHDAIKKLRSNMTREANRYVRSQKGWAAAVLDRNSTIRTAYAAWR